LADDHALLRDSLAQQLDREPDFKVVGQAGSAQDAWDATLEHLPNILILDIDMPGQSCFDVARQVHKRCPATKVLFLSAFFHDRYIEQAIAAQAFGYITKSEPAAKVIEALRRIVSGEPYYSEEVLARIVIDREGARIGPEHRSLARQLTNRELEILRLIARGLSKKEIGDILHISAKTVDNHTTSLMTKLKIHDRVMLARYAIREGLAEA
jgi:DNA-binding NarL/FixJ family response regulator